MATRVPNRYRDTRVVDWHAHFTAQALSPDSARTYCAKNNIPWATYKRIHKKYKLCTDKPKFKHFKHTGAKRRLTSSGETAVGSELITRRSKSDVVCGSVCRQLMFDEAQKRSPTPISIETISLKSVYSLLHRYDFTYKTVKLRTYNKTFIHDETLLRYQDTYKRLEVLFDRDCILNCDGTSCNTLLVPKRTMIRKYDDNGTLNIGINTNSRYTLLNDVIVFGTLKIKLGAIMTKMLIDRKSAPTLQQSILHCNDILKQFNTAHIEQCFDFVATAPLETLKRRSGVFEFIRARKEVVTTELHMLHMSDDSNID